MSPTAVGMLRKHKGTRVVVLETDPSAGTCKIAPLSSAKPKGDTPSVRVKTWLDEYSVLLGQASVVRVAELVTTWATPEKLNKSQLAILLREAGK